MNKFREAAMKRNPKLYQKPEKNKKMKKSKLYKLYGNPYMYEFSVAKQTWEEGKTRSNRVIGKNWQSACKQIHIRFPAQHGWIVLSCKKPDGTIVPKEEIL